MQKLECIHPQHITNCQEPKEEPGDTTKDLKILPGAEGVKVLIKEDGLKWAEKIKALAVDKFVGNRTGELEIKFEKDDRIPMLYIEIVRSELTTWAGIYGYCVNVACTNVNFSFKQIERPKPTKWDRFLDWLAHAIEREAGWIGLGFVFGAACTIFIPIFVYS